MEHIKNMGDANFVHLDTPLHRGNIGDINIFNVGDDIQVEAAKRFVPEFDGYITRGQLSTYRGRPIRMILNGWFMHKPFDWPPSPDIEPLLISFHMNPSAATVMLKRGRSFFERHGPVGCRDYQTLELFKKSGIPAYYSGCLTLTLERDKFVTGSTEGRCGVFAADVLYKMRAAGRRQRLLRSIGMRRRPERDRDRWEIQIIKTLTTTEKYREVQFIEHSRSLPLDDRDFRHKAARDVLGLYANAELVLTSRIHCALPCLAFGTPVIFVDGALDQHSERARLRGIIDLMPVLRVEADGTMDFKGLERDLTREATAQREDRIADIQGKLERDCYSFARSF